VVRSSTISCARRSTVLIIRFSTKLRVTASINSDFAARSNNSIKSAFYTLKTQKAENLEPKKPSVTDTTSEPINMMIEQTSPLNEIPGRDDKPATTDPVYNYHTFDNETTNK
jgi:hypothetical protein